DANGSQTGSVIKQRNAMSHIRAPVQDNVLIQQWAKVNRNPAFQVPDGTPSLHIGCRQFGFPVCHQRVPHTAESKKKTNEISWLG
ncbi:hypothetical protein ACLRDC_19530, partial [Gluconacetobacter sacchari]|uniref:hypothetical protein n=1 Tax=Gluconacetobacter sacchari TaxID=92759 RepID=UPI0039B52930